jgi:predicted transcriptional regulator
MTTKSPPEAKPGQNRALKYSQRVKIVASKTFSDPRDSGGCIELKPSMTPNIEHRVAVTKPEKQNYKITQSHKNKMVKLRIENKLSEEQIAKQLEISRDAVHYHLSRLIDTKALEDFKRNEADILSWNKLKLIKNLTDDKLKESKARDIAVAYGIFDDHERLQRGQSTSNTLVDVRMLITQVEDERHKEAKTPDPLIEHDTSD